MNSNKSLSYRSHADSPVPRRLSLLLSILVIGISAALAASSWGLDAVLVLGALLSIVVVLLDTYHGLFVIMIAFPFLVGFSSTVSAREEAFAILFIVWFLGWLMRYFLDRSGRVNFGWHPVALPTLALALLLATAALMGILTGATPMDVVRDLSQYVGYLVLLPVVGVIRYRKSAARLLKIAVIIGLPCYIWSSFIWWSRKFGLEYGGMDTAQVGGAYLGPIVGALWPLALLKTGWWTRRLATLGLFILFLYALGSGYRSQIISVVVMTSVAIWAIWKTQSGKRKVMVAIPIILGIVFVIWLIGGTVGYLPLPGGARSQYLYSSLLSPEQLISNISVQGRLVEAKAALRVFQRYPLLGIGFGHHVPMEWAYGTWYKTAFTQHIWITEVLMKFGVLGMLVFIWFFVAILRLAYVVAKNASDPIVKAIALGVFIWLSTSLIPTAGSISNRGFTFMVGLMGGILPALAGINRARRKAEITRVSGARAITSND